MKYCIYNGSIALIKSIKNDYASIEDDFGEQHVMTVQIILISDEFESEINTAKEELKQLNFRLSRLDAEYHKKSEALKELYMTAREKELQIINRLLKAVKSNIDKGGTSDE